MNWTEIEPGTHWTRSDGAIVQEIDFFCFRVTTAEGMFLLDEDGPRSWERSQDAMDALDALDSASQITIARSYDERVTEAATAVQKAIQAHTGRVRPLHAWKPIAAKLLGLSRLVTKRWQGVLDRGVELGLFAIDDTSFSYPVLKPLEPIPEPIEEDLEGVPIDRAQLEIDDDELDLDWEPPTFLDCGHLDEGQGPEAVCSDCENKRPPSWRHLRGRFVRPVPVGNRRTKAKVGGLGFEGLCCNAEGIFIGGYFNDCRRTGDERCEVHASGRST